MDATTLTEALEASCEDKAKWRKKYRQRVVNAGGDPFTVLMGPGVEPLPGKEKGVRSPKIADQLPEQVLEDLGLPGGHEEEDEKEMTEPIINTIVKDCGTLLGELEEEDLMQVALEASAADASNGRVRSRHEDDTPGAAVLRRTLCTRRGARGRCKMAAADRKAGAAPANKKKATKQKKRKA